MSVYGKPLRHGRKESKTQRTRVKEKEEKKIQRKRAKKKGGKEEITADRPIIIRKERKTQTTRAEGTVEKEKQLQKDDNRL